MVAGKPEGSALAAEHLPADGGKGHHNRIPGTTPESGFRHESRRERGPVEAWKRCSSSPADRPAVARKKDPQRSRISNGSALLPGVDGRSPWVRRCKDVIAAHLSDLGGTDNTSAAERSIVRRAAVLTAQLEQLEVRFALADGAASAEDLDLYQRTASTLRRLLEAVGIQRRRKDITPSLADILREQQP